MKLFATLYLAVIMILTGGCASTPVALPEAEYEKVATNWYILNTCASAGQMPTDVAAGGLNILRYNLSRYAYDDARLNANLERLTGRSPTQEQCNQMAMLVHQHRQQADATDRRLRSQQEEANQFINATKIPRPVYCNKIGTTMVCN